MTITATGFGGDTHEPLLRRETLRAVASEHRDLLLSLRALTMLLREPDPETGDEADAILARILEAQLNQVSVLDGELITALRLEQGDVGPVRAVDLARLLRKAARRSGRLTVVNTRGPVPVRGHADVIEQEIASVLALAHRIAERVVSASAEARNGGGTVRVRVEAQDDELSRARTDERVSLLHRMVRAEGGRLVLERDESGTVTLHLNFSERR